MIHVKFIQRPKVLEKYQNQYNVLNMDNVQNNVNILQLYDTKDHKDALKNNLKRLSKIYLLLTHQKKVSKQKRNDLLKTFRLFMVGFYKEFGLIDNHFHLKPLNYKSNEFPTIPLFVQYLTKQFKANVNKPNTLSLLESLEIAFNNVSSSFNGVATHYTNLDSVIDDAVQKHQTKLVINLVPFYDARMPEALYAIALTAIAFFKDYGTKHPNVSIQLDVRDLMTEPKFKPQDKTKKHIEHYERNYNRSIPRTNVRDNNYHYDDNRNNHIVNYHDTTDDYVPRHSSDIDESVGNVGTINNNYRNERKTSMVNNQEDLVKNMYFTDLIQHRFGKAQHDLQGLKRDLSTSDYQMLTSDLADQKEAFRKFGDDLTNIAEKLFD